MIGLCLTATACQGRTGRATPTPAGETRADVCADDACINGTVVAVTPTGAIVPLTMAPVTLAGPANRIVQTNADGRFIFTSLVPGLYTISVPEAGAGYDFSPSRSTLSQRAQRRQIDAARTQVTVPPKADLAFTFVHTASGLKP